MILQPTLLTLMCALRNTNNKFYHIQMTDRISVAIENWLAILKIAPFIVVAIAI